MSLSELKAEILRLTREYSRQMHRANRPDGDPLRAEFVPGQSTVPYAGRVFTEDEVEAAVRSTLDFWLTLGPEGEAFEQELAALLGVKHSVLVNSGSSANLVALSALTSPKLPAPKRIRPGDEVITVAAGFPTTVAPIVQNGAVPVFIDNDPVTGNARVDQLEAAFVAGKTKAVMMAHTLGNPFDLGAVLEFCRRHDLWLIEDNCDALGCTYTMPVERARQLGLDHLLKIAESGTHPVIKIHPLKDRPADTLKSAADVRSDSQLSTLPPPPSLRRTGNSSGSGQGLSGSECQRVSMSACQLFLTAPTGAWGDLSTQSFYPPHHLTMGEGGAVNIVSRPPLKTYVESFRDWGRDCWCASGKDNTCGKRFDWQLGELPRGYDHKYIYSHLGYNLKPLDLQAAIGRAQLKKLPAFIEARKRNWEHLRAGLADLEAFFEFTLPTHATAWRGGNAETLTAVPSERDSLPTLKSAPMSASQPVSVSECQHLSVSGQPVSFSAFHWSPSFRTDPSWFGFMLRVRPGAPFTHTQLARHLDEKKIGNRMLFGGNLVRQPAFVQLKKDNPAAFRVIGDLAGADALMREALFLGTYPGLTPAMLDYEIAVIREFVKSR